MPHWLLPWFSWVQGLPHCFWQMQIAMQVSPIPLHHQLGTGLTGMTLKPWDPAAHHNSAFPQHTVSDNMLAPFGKAAGFLFSFFFFWRFVFSSAHSGTFYTLG